MRWNPFTLNSWTDASGLAGARLFGADRRIVNGDCSVLLDGRDSSLILAFGDDSDWLFGDPSLLSWSWSSYIRHVLAIKIDSGSVLWRKWNSPNATRRFKLPRTAEDACSIIETIGADRPHRGVDVVSHALAIFKQLRSSLSPYRAGNRLVVLAFNAMLDALAANTGVNTEWEHIRDIIDMEDETGPFADLRELGEVPIGETLDSLATSTQAIDLALNPYLLMRHASGYVYQEAHFELERTRWVQRRLDGSLEPNTRKGGTRQRDAHFTPPELARALAEQALNHFGTDIPSSLCVLDPACGSGEFLQAILRELEHRSYTGDVELRGYDSSAVSVEMARYCLRETQQQCIQSGMRVTSEIQERNAIAVSEDWGQPHVVLMNPPFTRWEDMTEGDKRDVEETLGVLKTSRVDKAMAFVWKACQSVIPGGVIATVIPSPMLESSFAQAAREAIEQSCIIECIGRLNGYGYFPGALVEPAFLVLGKERDVGVATRPLTVVVAEPGSASDALRALRRKDASAPESSGYYIDVNAERSWLTSVSWVPRTLQYADLLDRLAESLPTVDALFSVEQGVLTGMNRAFVLPAKRYRELVRTAQEKRWFRPVAGSSTIRDGQLFRERFVFYPYDESGALLLDTESKVREAVPEFFADRLAPNRQPLAERRDKAELWWTLNWPRPYQAGRQPRLVSAHFGDSGSFAFDESGAFLVLQGWVWRWRDAATHSAFLASDSPLAYVALLNSAVFESLLSCFCPRVQGGQFDLSQRHVKKLFVPDLFSGILPSDITDKLAEIGNGMRRGEEYSSDELNSLVMRTYGVAPGLWRLNGP